MIQIIDKQIKFYSFSFTSKSVPTISASGFMNKICLQETRPQLGPTLLYLRFFKILVKALTDSPLDILQSNPYSIDSQTWHILITNISPIILHHLFNRNDFLLHLITQTSLWIHRPRSFHNNYINVHLPFIRFDRTH